MVSLEDLVTRRPSARHKYHQTAFVIPISWFPLTIITPGLNPASRYLFFLPITGMQQNHAQRQENVFTHCYEVFSPTFLRWQTRDWVELVGRLSGFWRLAIRSLLGFVVLVGGHAKIREKNKEDKNGPANDH